MVDSFTSIDNTNLASAVRENFRKVLEDNISDPTNSEKRKFIYERSPHVKGSDFDGYPILIIQDYSTESVSENLNDHLVFWEGTFEVHVEASEDMPDHFDTLSDKLMETFKGSKPRENLGSQGITRVSIDRNQRNTSIDVKDEFIFRREVEISFLMTIDMS